MATLLSVCVKEEQHPVIQVLWAEGVPGTEIHCQTFNTIRKQSFTKAEFVRMDNY
jgi:microcystin degradation protein MlrC